MDTRTKEAVRYLGYGRHAVDDHTLALIGEAFEELDLMAAKRIVYRIFGLTLKEQDCVVIGDLCIRSRSLSKNLKGCDMAAVLGATLGIEIDMYMKKLSITNMAKAVIVQSCAAALLEEYVDSCQLEIEQEAKERGLYLRPRFSPGYGDFPIEHQEQILRMLDTAKKIGLTMTGSSMLTPTKSVTAVIGMSRIKEPCHRKGCEMCGMTDCPYRR
ncbi:vitamin B12 dependent-methionine synthase activation domain-containing protein [Dorea sp. D27]|uniref:vitamin B12 dependent-methionine synthase activation domain-containing protein n=1 Tax=Dorea sp. D27 TaxID=658665 RepID=UPI0006731DCF|nr:vitamin B12 dependent-methionine synthase activation domain-containing protein [Dorea sp. D27]KMZ54728.1 putative cytosolic protein [Dorea sp. D27]